MNFSLSWSLETLCRFQLAHSVLVGLLSTSGFYIPFWYSGEAIEYASFLQTGSFIIQWVLTSAVCYKLLEY